MNKQINHTTGPLAALHRTCAKGKPIVEVPAIDEKAEKTRKLQAQFICPIWAVWYGIDLKGDTVSLYFTSYHCEQFVRALRLNGTPCAAYNGRGEMVEG